MTDTVEFFGQLLPEKRIANVAGIEVDVTRIPARLSLEAMKLSDGGKPDIEGVVKLLAKICQTSAPEITEDFLLDHLDITEIGSMMRFIVEPLAKKTESLDAGSVGDVEAKNG